MPGVPPRPGSWTGGGQDDTRDLLPGGVRISGLLPVGIWVTTTTLGLFLFAWMMRRPHREDESPFAAALSMVAAANETFRREFTGPSNGAGQAEPSSASETASTADSWLAALGPDTSRLSGNRPTGWQSRPPLHFDLPPAKDTVRRQITYRLVRLSDGPDDLRSKELLRLDRGDEIEILGQEGSYLQVRTPTGAIGWIPHLSIIG
jgi:hypothetical protein